MELTGKAKKLYEETYDLAIARYGEDKAQKIASLAVDKQFIVQNGILVGKSKLFGKINSHEELILMSAGSREPLHFVEGYIATTGIDGNGHFITSKVLRSLANQMSDSYVSVKGNVEHDTVKQFGSSENPLVNKATYNPKADYVAKVVDAKVDGKGLFVRTIMNPNSTRFKSIWNQIQGKWIDGFSIEIAIPDKGFVKKKIGGKEFTEIHEARIAGFAFTENPDNREAKITASYIG